MNAISVDSATQTSDLESDDDSFRLPNVSPRAIIDTSPPFRSVEEAVIRFGGRGFWIPGSVLADVDAPAAATHSHEPEVSDINKLEERTVAMLKDLQFKDTETQDILKELELTKRLVEDLKLKLSTESPEFSSVQCLDFTKDCDKDSLDSITSQSCKLEEHSDACASSATGLIMSELKQAKLNLHQNTSELTAIRASVESLSKKLEEEKSSIEKVQDPQSRDSKYLGISRELRELNNEAYQFMRTAEAAKSEVVTAMSEIEQTKTGLKVVEMRWLMAKKLEEAARAVESVALAETRALSSHTESVLHKPATINLTLEEYSALTEKARKASKLFKRNSIPLASRRDSRLLDSNDFEFVRNGFKSSTSLGDILSRKFVQENGGVGRERVSLNQMLCRQREETSPQRRREGGKPKGLFSRRKGLGLVHISFPLSKHGKNKIRALNHM